MAKIKTQPELRFAGFTEDWEVKDFEKVFTNISNNSLSREKLNYVSGLAKNVHYGDILVKFNDVLDVKKEVLPYVSDNATVEKLKNSFLKDGDIIISDAAEDETVGKCVELYNINDEKIFSGLHTIAVRPKENFASKFLGYYMNSSSYHEQLLKLMQGTKVLSISKTAIKKTVIRNPKSKSEQKLIGNFFDNIDNLITEHQQKHSKLKALKQAMLGKMFPKHGQVVPEIRFKGFEGEWEEKRLGVLGDFIKGKGLSKNIVSNSGKYKCVLYGHLYTDYDMLIEKINYSTDVEFRTAVKSQFGDVLFPSSDTTPTGLARACCIEKEGVILGGDINILRPNELVIGRFLSFNINANRKKLIPLIKGIAVRHIYNSDLEMVEISIPNNIEEQKKIGNYFKNLDELIDSHECQITKLQNIKKALLAKMFI